MKLKNRLGAPDLHVQQIKHPGVVQGEDALDDQDVWRVNGGGLLHASMFFERIDGNFGSFPKSL